VERVALVTGANRGIGFEVCRQLGRRGYVVVLGSRDRERGEVAAARLRGEGLDVVGCQLDVADAASVESAVERMRREHGRLYAVVNNAAILYDTWAQARSADLDEVQRALDTNLFGAWRVTQALLPLLLRSPHPRVVNVSSEGGSLASMNGGTPAYSVSKAALNALTRLLAGELRGRRVLVNAVCPGWVATDMGGAGGRPISDGAAGIVWAVELPDDGPTSGFFCDGRAIAW